MDRQAIINKVAQHLRKQGKPAIAKRGGCAYRSHDGASACAVGVLIPDDQYEPHMEGPWVGELVRLFPFLRGTFGIENDTDVDFLRAMQDDVHDKLFRELDRWVSGLEGRIEAFCERSGLSYKATLS